VVSNQIKPALFSQKDWVRHQAMQVILTLKCSIELPGTQLGFLKISDDEDVLTNSQKCAFLTLVRGLSKSSSNVIFGDPLQREMFLYGTRRLMSSNHALFRYTGITFLNRCLSESLFEPSEVKRFPGMKDMIVNHFFSDIRKEAINCFGALFDADYDDMSFQSKLLAEAID